MYSYKENKPIKLKIDPSNWNDVVDTMVGYSLVFGSRANLGKAKICSLRGLISRSRAKKKKKKSARTFKYFIPREKKRVILGGLSPPGM